MANDSGFQDQMKELDKLYTLMAIGELAGTSKTVDQLPAHGRNSSGTCYS